MLFKSRAPAPRRRTNFRIARKDINQQWPRRKHLLPAGGQPDSALPPVGRWQPSRASPDELLASQFGLGVEAEQPTRSRSRPVARTGDMPVQSGQISQSKGLVSIDRSVVAALLSTTPRPRPRSSTNDLAPLHRWDGCIFDQCARHICERTTIG